MSTRAKQLTKDITQPTKGVGCKLDPDIYHGITTGLVAGRTVADLSVQGNRSNLFYPRNSKGGSEETGWGAISSI